MSRPSSTICVVDRHLGDYQGWKSLADESGVRLHFVASAEEALRLSRSTPVDLWVVNTELPSLSGMELCGMLRQRNRQTAVYLVCESNSPEAERAAWAARPTLVGRQGEQKEWLARWVDHNQQRSNLPLVS